MDKYFYFCDTFCLSVPKRVTEKRKKISVFKESAANDRALASPGAPASSPLARHLIDPRIRHVLILSFLFLRCSYFSPFFFYVASLFTRLFFFPFLAQLASILAHPPFSYLVTRYSFLDFPFIFHPGRLLADL